LILLRKGTDEVSAMLLAAGDQFNGGIVFKGSFERHILQAHDFHQMIMSINFAVGVLASQPPCTLVVLGNWDLSLANLEVFSRL